MRITDKYVFFWGSMLSNFFPYENKSVETNSVKPLNFEKNGIKWKTSEHYFMYQKAIYFKDFETAKKIISATRPEVAKKLGRQVKNFNAEEWSKVSEDAMYMAVYAKFSQNKELRMALLDPKFDGKEFVEASPFDRIWGIGLHYNDEKCDDPNNWLGENKLGKILNKVRQALQNE